MPTAGRRPLPAALTTLWPASTAWTPGKDISSCSLDRVLARRTEQIVANTVGRARFLRASRSAGRADAGHCQRRSPRGRQPLYAAEVLLAELGLPADSRLVGLVGRLWLQKRIKDAIWVTDLLKVFRERRAPADFRRRPAAPTAVQFPPTRLRILDKVHFLGHREDVPDWLPHFDVLLSTSGFEGQSNAILEAMAAGVPVVATDIPGTRDLVTRPRPVAWCR